MGQGVAMKIASVQLEIKEDKTKEEKLDYALSQMDQCRDAELIILPELWNIGFFNYNCYVSGSEPLDGLTASAISAKAKELGSFVHSGSFVEHQNGQYFNTSILFDPSGKKIAVYRKIHLFSYQCREPEILTPGSHVTVADTELGKIGLATCYDLRFPELFRKMTLTHGAEYLLVTSAWPLVRLDAWNLLTRTRALENTCCLISCNAAGTNEEIVLGGHSQIIDPLGNQLAGSGQAPCIVRGEFPRDRIANIRKDFPVLKDVRL